MLQRPAPTDQRAGVRPIAFALQNGMSIGTPITLKIRPEDLTRNEPSRTAVHQTLGRTVTGWVDNFGAALPSVTISGHTGWRSTAGTQQDGVQAFLELNKLVHEDYHNAKQAAIDTGRDPATVKLIFIDMLDDFVWSVTPTTFQLRRSKSRPLLMMYSINLQAVSVDIDTPFMVLPFLPNLPAGLQALGRLISFLHSVSTSIQAWVAKAVSFKDKALAPIASTVAQFSALSLAVFTEVSAATSAINYGVNSTANSLIAIADDLASVGINVFRTIAAIDGVDSNTKQAISRVGAAYNEALCIFRNSLKPPKFYEEYTGLYGASNCSSTTGGRGPSAYSSSNVFGLMQNPKTPVSMTSAAQASAKVIVASDVVMDPLEIAEIGRLLSDVNSGVTVP
jgi:hypothetical protein